MKNFKRGLQKHASLIFTSIGVAGIMATAGIGVWVGMKTAEIKSGLGALPEDRKERFKLYVKTMWKYYVVLSLSAIASAGSVIASHKVSAKDIARLATLATGSGAAFKTYRGKVKELLGEEKEKEIYEKVEAEKDWYVWPSGTDQDSEEYNRLDTPYRLDLGVDAIKPVEFYSNQLRVLHGLMGFERNFVLGRLTNVGELKDFLGIPYDEKIDFSYFWMDEAFYSCDMSPYIDYDDRGTGEFDKNGKEIRLLTFESCPPINEKEYRDIVNGTYWDQWKNAIENDK